jgi:hypothetical protein
LILLDKVLKHVSMRIDNTILSIRLLDITQCKFDSQITATLKYQNTASLTLAINPIVAILNNK